jgi:hypothetical protein
MTDIVHARDEHSEARAGLGAPYVYNFMPLRPDEYHGGAVPIRRLPKDYVAINKAMGYWDPDPNGSVDDGAKWWMFEDETVPYSPEDTGSKYDQPFLPGRDLYIWAAVFDHTQTRHTRHPRPVRLSVEE